MNATSNRPNQTKSAKPNLSYLRYQTKLKQIYQTKPTKATKVNHKNWIPETNWQIKILFIDQRKQWSNQSQTSLSLHSSAQLVIIHLANETYWDLLFLLSAKLSPNFNPNKLQLTHPSPTHPLKFYLFIAQALAYWLPSRDHFNFIWSSSTLTLK